MNKNIADFKKKCILPIKKEIKSLVDRCLYVIHELRFNKIVV